MAFQYSFKLNGEPLYATLGASVVDKLDEALDESALHIPITVRDYEYKMYGVLEIIVDDDINTPLTFNYLIVDDTVKVKSKDGWYSHSLSAIEYTNKLDKYLINALTFTKPFEQKVRAPFSIVNFNTTSLNLFGIFPKIHINAYYSTDINYTIPQVAQMLFNNAPSGSLNKDVHIVVDGGSAHNLTASDLTLNFSQSDVGDILIQIGCFPASTFVPVYEFYVRVYENVKYSLYDIVQRIRALVPIEIKYYFDLTRVFDLSTSLVERFKKIEMPQMFFQKQTARQVLNTVFKYINSISRLSYVADNPDTLSIDEFNKITGSFDMGAVIDFETSQNVQQYATKAISWLENSLQSNFRENPSIQSPSAGRYKTVRAKKVQLTETGGGFVLPLEKKIYQLSKFEVIIPFVTIKENFEFPQVETAEYVLDLTARMLEKTKWDLKDFSTNFLTYPEILPYDTTIGLRSNKMGNFYWERGKDYIDFSLEIGDVIKNNLVNEVIQEALNEEITLNPIIIPSAVDVFDLQTAYKHMETGDISSTTELYRNFAFNIEYTTLDNPALQVDRADVSNINYYSEMRINPQERQADFNRSSRNSYGQLQRAGVPNQSFSKVYTDLTDILKVGMFDSEGYTITQRQLIFYNEHIIANYEMSLNHNRLNEFNGIDQEYRVFENPLYGGVYDRRDLYNDYLIMVSPETNLSEELTLIGDGLLYNASDVLTQHSTGNTKITGAFVRTDGFLEQYPDDVGGSEYFAIMRPVNVQAGKNVISFTFGFNNNLHSGSALYKDTAGNFFNSPVFYTDERGFFDEFWFGLFSEYVATENFDVIGETYEDIFNREYQYPLIKSSSSDLGQNFKIVTGSPLVANGAYNPIISYKDASSNYSVTYQISMQPFDYKKYVIGESFTLNSKIANNYDTLEERPMYIYLYTDGTQYGKFDDLEVKNDVSNYTFTKTLLVPSTNIIDSFSVDGIYGVHFQGNISMTGVTSWAIADDLDNLFIACNSNCNGYRWVRRHFRPNISGIGNKVLSILALFGTAGTVNITTDIQVSGFQSTDLFGAETVIITTDISISGFQSTNLSGAETISITTDIEILGVQSTNLFGSETISITTDIVEDGVQSTNLFGAETIIISTDIVEDGFASTNLFGAETIVITTTITYERENLVRFFDYDGTTLLKQEEVADGNDATPPTDPTRVGYIFHDWSVDYTNVTSDLDILATYNYAPIAPTITYVSKTASSISFTITNNNPYTTTIYYEENDSTPDANLFTLGGGLTSGTLTISGLTSNTEYNVYAQSRISIYASTASFITETTDMRNLATPSISSSCVIDGGTRTLSYSATNNDTETVTMYLEINDTTPDISRGTVVGGGSTATYESVIASSVTIYAQATKTGFNNSDIVSQYFNIGFCLV